MSNCRYSGFSCLIVGMAAVLGWLPVILSAQNLADELTPLGYYSGDPLPPKTVYLSFDDGPGEFTDALLDILRQKQVRATFFINSFNRDVPREQIGTTNYLLRYRATLVRMVADGNVIGNHSFSHRDLAALDVQHIAFELDTLQRHLDEALGRAAPVLHLIRPPWGSPWFGSWGTRAQKRKVAAVIATRGLVINWTNAWNSTDSAEWVKGEWYRSSDPRYHLSPAWAVKEQRMLNHILEKADGQASGVILMHDIHPTTRDMLARLIDRLRERGYTFATLDEYCRWRWGDQVFAGFAKR